MNTPEQLGQLLRERVFGKKIDWGANRWHESVELSPAVAVAQILEQHKSLMVVLPSPEEVRQLHDDLRALGQASLIFPSLYFSGLNKGIRSQNRWFTERSAILARLLEGGPVLLLCSLPALAPILPPPASFAANILRLEAGSQWQPAELAGLLSDYGYYQVPRVSLPGEFARRGEVIDFFPPHSEDAVRVMFGFDEVEILKVFDISSQISRHPIAEFRLFPLKEVLWQEPQRNCLQQQLEDWALEEQDEGRLNEQLQEIEELLSSLAWQREVPFEELLFPLAWGSPARLLDYMPESSVVFWGYQHLKQQKARYLLELETFCEQQLPLFLRKLPELFAIDLGQCAIIVDELEGETWPLEFEASLQYHGNLKRFSEDLRQWLEQDYYVAIGCTSAAQAQRLGHALAPGPHFFPAELSRGLLFPQQKLALLQEWEILGTQRSSRNEGEKQGTAKRLSQSEIISSFVELKEGDLVVHVQHGVGRFTGIERIVTSRLERDYLALEYAEGSTLFVPIEQVNMVQRYIGAGGETEPRLDRIGGKAWRERKARTRKAVEDLADRLLRLYSRRAAVDGFCYAPDDEWMEEFEADFPYEATVDQLRAVQEIKQDLESPKPMDRLLCGDVGFGKTEVAMRASFKVASQGRQVLLLCPTTILAEQHYQNFTKRFARFPLRLAMLSRFVERSEQKAILNALENGAVDILIGTHRILSKDIQLRNLGLIVIDEEQRFGVKHKERLKMLKTSVDCLSMSATPIPRTLHMSLVQIRDISMLTTAPRNRQPVKTFVREFNPQSIANAIRLELERGGQVFYLHNRVEGLEEILLFLRDLVPEALIEMAHGQMESRSLENIMYRFVHRGFNVLLATSIIENGIDIPSVNTIIIDRADRYGISQLYQLRGRVGRSDQLAYAYLFYPDRSGLSDLALKRLKIISDFTELGSGFKVAMKDLEVRGAGNLLGPEQSGNIISVGFEMYSSMLAQAIRERGPELPALTDDILLEMDYSGFIPDAYIPDATEKIDLYKRIASIDQDETLAAFYEELYDRFGEPPVEVHSLLSLAEIRSICRKAGIHFLKEGGGKVELRFCRSRPVPLEKIMQQIKQYPKIFRLDAKNSEALFIDLGVFMQHNKENTSPALLSKTAALRQLLSTFL